MGKTDDICVDDKLTTSLINTENTILPLYGLPDRPVLPVKCCLPLPGDRVVGLVFDDNSGVEIHLESCRVVKNAMIIGGARLIDLHWKKHAFSMEAKYLTRLSITMRYNAGNLSKIAKVVEEKGANIVNLHIHEKFNSFVSLLLEVELRDITHLMSVNAALRSCDFVTEVERK